MIIDLRDRKTRILEDITSEVLFRKYAGISEGKMLCPFHKEKTGSLSISGNKNRFRCFGCSKNGDIFDYIGLLYGVDFGQVLEIIEKDYPLRKRGQSIAYKRERDKGEISWRCVDYREKDIKYWSQYGINKNILVSNKVYPLDLIKFGGTPLYIDYRDNLAYLYWFKLGWKIYIPYGRNRFYSNKSCIQGLEGLDYRDSRLIVTKAFKDVLLFRQLGYNAIAPGSENTMISDKAMRYLCRRFKVIINFDNDTAGIEARDKYISMYGLDWIQSDYKDFTDEVKYSGIDKVKLKLKELLNVK